jgi:hypothetical protein
MVGGLTSQVRGGRDVLTSMVFGGMRAIIL